MGDLMDDAVELQALPVVQIIDDAVMPPKRAKGVDDLETIYYPEEGDQDLIIFEASLLVTMSIQSQDAANTGSFSIPTDIDGDLIDVEGLWIVFLIAFLILESECCKAFILYMKSHK